MNYRICKKDQKAVALVTVLLIITMLSILVLTFFTTMRIEHRSAVSFADTQRAKMVSQGAVAHAIEMLRRNVPEPAAINESAASAKALNWAINPGRLVTFDDKGKTTVIPLHTGGADKDPNDTGDPDVYSVDLNEPVPGNTEPAICYALDDDGNATSGIPAMRVKWVNILKDPSKEASVENPIIARHAFWMDDESGKLNFNTALGKPSRESTTNWDKGFFKEFDDGFMPPNFLADITGLNATNEDSRRWFSLGNLRSVNLDVLFDNPSLLNGEQLMAHGFLRGFSRYPEAILEYVEMNDAEKMEWWRRNRYNLTFYSRSPEFNAFGRPRLMTTNMPLSLEGGPYYQLPFVYNGPGAPDTLQDLKGILHMSSLLGYLGFTTTVEDDDGLAQPANIVNRAQAEMLMRYFRRTFPGYSGSFVDKYGEAECAQIALNFLTMARLATSGISNLNPNAYSESMAWRSTSVIYAPHTTERPGANPERHYWRFDPGTSKFLTRDEPSTPSTIPMLPATPGPHIMEVRMVFKPEPTPDNPTENFLSFRLETEYYIHGVTGFTRLDKYPMKTDYLKLSVTAGGKTTTCQLGPKDPVEGLSRADRNWNHPNQNTSHAHYDRSLQSLQVWPPAPDPDPSFDENYGINDDIQYQIRPYDPSKANQINRRVVKGPWRYFRNHNRLLAHPATDSEKMRFKKLDSVQVEIAYRGGMSIATINANGVPSVIARPRQMFPLGEGEDDVLTASLDIDMSNDQPVSLSWQIVDPRLSCHKDAWTLTVADDDSAGTLGAINAGEPDEDSTEKSKFKYIQRGPGTVRGRLINRGDEYNSNSRVASKGFWAVIPTGIQSKIPWRTIRLAPNDPAPGPPDWLLMDLLGATYPMQRDQWKINSTTPDEFSTVSYMHSTTGAINLNTKTYPDDSKYFEAPQRVKPVYAVFKNLRTNEEVSDLVKGIKSYQDNSFFKYVGELSEVSGFERSGTATQFENEELLRNMIGCLTTKSNTFGVWGVGQVVKKLRTNEDYGVFEDGDSVRGEKRFFALVERYVWPGIDGVPGNAHVDSQGAWDRTAKQSQDIPVGTDVVANALFQLPGSPPTKMNANGGINLDLTGTYPEFDGPQEVEMDQYASAVLGKVAWRPSKLEDAYNPPQPVIKYRVVYFKYLDE